MKCPRCGGDCERDEVDVGVGIMPCGPWGCPACHWVDGDTPPLAIDDPIPGDDVPAVGLGEETP